MQIIAFIPAKGTSKRLPGKNLKIFGNKPLFCHAILNAQRSKLIDKVVIDSDSTKILDIGESYGAIPLKRSRELADNRTTGDDLAFWEAKNYPDYDIIVQISPTAPFLLPSSIDGAIKILCEKPIDSVAGVFKDKFYEWFDIKPAYYLNDKIPNSFELDEVIYETMGLNVFHTHFALKHKKRININSCWPYYLSRIEAIDINTKEDFKFAEIVWKGLKNK